MIKDSLAKALSDQINAEYYSAYLYLTMSAYANRCGYKGVENWLFVQAREEMAHGTHIFQHLLDRGASPSFADIKAPQASFESIKDVFEQVLAHERHVTELINRIATLAFKESDHATDNFITWYVNEQVEEEANADELVGKLRNIGDDQSLLYSIDAELGARQFVDPFPQTNA
jgi:ferritin